MIRITFSLTGTKFATMRITKLDTNFIIRHHYIKKYNQNCAELIYKL